MLKYIKYTLLALLIHTSNSFSGDVMDVFTYQHEHRNIYSQHTGKSAPDVHLFDQLSKDKGPVIIEYGKTFNISHTHSPESVFWEIVEHTKSNCPNDLEDIERVKKIIMNSTPIDPVTGLNVHELLSGSWSLAKKTKDIGHKTHITLSLSDNTQMGGGCYTGIANRLLLIYAEGLVELAHLVGQTDVS